jgi:hypothetical protein
MITFVFLSVPDALDGVLFLSHTGTPKSHHQSFLLKGNWVFQKTSLKAVNEISFLIIYWQAKTHRAQ